MLNVRLDEETDKMLKEYSINKNVSKSAIVKEALAMYFSNEKSLESPYNLGEDLFGTDGSGKSNASKSYKSKLKDKLNAKHSH